MRIFTYLLLLTNILFSIAANAKEAPIVSRNDPEIKESSKCVMHFNRLEKKYEIPKDLLHSISIQESGKKHSKLAKRIPSPWAVNVAGQGHYFDSKRDAVAFVESQLSKGKKNIDVGCMQISLLYHGDAFKSVSEAFDPKANVEYGAMFLREKFDQHGSWKKAIANYHSADYERGNSYQKSVLKIASNIDDHKFGIINTPNLLRTGKPLYALHNKPNPLYAQRQSRFRSSMMVHVPRNARRIN